MDREKIKTFHPGKKNAITDIAGVKVGQLTVNRDITTSTGDNACIRTGMTAILPYPMEKEMRLFMRSYSLRGIGDSTGYEVSDDFCYLNSPVVLANSFNVGAVYNAVLSYGFSLKRVEIWPPLIFGIDDSFLNDITNYTPDEGDVLNTLQKASPGPVEQGSVGIGLGLRSYGYKGGIGTASRMIELAGQNFLCGVLVASNHSNPLQAEPTAAEIRIRKDGHQGSFTLVMGVDIPLIPCQIDWIIKNRILSLDPLHRPEANPDDISCVLFSTANPMSMEEGGPMIREFRTIDDVRLSIIAMAAKEAVMEALANSLLKASPTKGRKGRLCRTIPEADLKIRIKNVV